MRPAGTSPSDRATGAQDATRERSTPVTDYVHITAPCGVDQTVAEGATDWILDRHAHAHQKGIDGLSAGPCGIAVAPCSSPPLPERSGAEAGLEAGS
jgi:hypothetical protein